MLAFVFASFLAVLPLAVAGVSILTTFLALRAVTEVTDVSFIAEYLIALVGLGVGIDHASVNVAGIKASDTSVDFMGLLHLGARMGPSQRFFGDIQLGLLSDSFVFIPSIGWTF